MDVLKRLNTLAINFLKASLKAGNYSGMKNETSLRALIKIVLSEVSKAQRTYFTKGSSLVEN